MHTHRRNCCDEKEQLLNIFTCVKKGIKTAVKVKPFIQTKTRRAFKICILVPGLQLFCFVHE